MKKSIQIPLIIVVLLAGFAILFYPDISSWYNSQVHAELLFQHDEELAQLRDDYIEHHRARAQMFNENLGGFNVRDPFVAGSGAVLPPAYYFETLNIGGIMAQLEIPAINVALPVFHSTCNSVLNRAVGHLEGTSFPIGGINTHAVLTAHAAWPTHRLFTDLEELAYGDMFFVRVLGETLAYEVDQILTVLPHQIEDIRILQGRDIVTLLTCTPYRINSHRLLVRGTRIAYEPGMIYEIPSILPEETITTDTRLMIIIGVLCFFLLFLLVSKILVYQLQRRKERNRQWAIRRERFLLEELGI